MAVNWGLLDVPDIGGNFLAAVEQGKQRRLQQEQQNALAAYAMNPSEGGLAGLAQVNPMLAIQERGRFAEQRQAQQAQRRDELGIIDRLLDGVADDATYKQRLAIAQQNGIDTSSAPADFDPNWVGSMRMMVRAIRQDGPQALSNYGKIAIDRGFQPGTPEFTAFVAQAWEADNRKVVPVTEGGGAFVLGTDGQFRPAIVPNTGGAAPGSPAGGGVQEGATATNPQTGQKIQFRNGQWVPMGGGTQSSAPRPFDLSQRWQNGVVTSGRRTPEGNRLVGGVPDSWHVSGDAFDLDGGNLNALLTEAQQRYPNAKAFIHDGHVHVQQRGLNVPYFGQRGTTGLRTR